MQNGMKRCPQIRLRRDAATVNGLYGRNLERDWSDKKSEYVNKEKAP